MRNELTNPWLLSVAEMERTIDRVIDALVMMDVEILVGLADVCSGWDTAGARVSVSEAMQARLSWKLLLLDRLLRQTRVNLNILGLAPEQQPYANGFRPLGGY